MVEKAEFRQTATENVTFRAVLLGLLLIPVNTYFIMANHLRFWSTLPTTMALIYNVVITLTVLIAFNLLVKRFLPRFALKQQELLTIFCDAFNFFSDLWARHDANGCANGSRRFLVRHP